MDLTQRARVMADVMARRAGDETVVLDVTTGSYFSLNEVGARVWTLLEGGLTLAEVCAALSSEYDVGMGEVQADVLSLVAELETNRLISVA